MLDITPDHVEPATELRKQVSSGLDIQPALMNQDFPLAHALDHLAAGEHQRGLSGKMSQTLLDSVVRRVRDGPWLSIGQAGTPSETSV